MPGSEPGKSLKPRDKPRRVAGLKSGSESSPLARLGRLGRTGDDGSEMGTPEAPSPSTSPDDNSDVPKKQTVFTPERSALYSLRPPSAHEPRSPDDASLYGAKHGPTDKSRVQGNVSPGRSFAEDRGPSPPKKNLAKSKDERERKEIFEREKAGWPAPHGQKGPALAAAECRNKSDQFTLPKITWRKNYDFVDPIDPQVNSAASSRRQGGNHGQKSNAANRVSKIRDFFQRVMFKGSRRFYQNFNHPEPFIKKSRETSINDFHIKHYVAAGAFGTVVLCQEKTTKRHVAVKVLPRDKIVNRLKIRHLLRERDILRSVEFPFIVYLLYAFKDNASLYMVMRFCPGGDLFMLLRKNRTFNEAVAKFYASQVVLGLEYLHNALVVYRDLKPENLMVTENGYIRISDLGFARIIKTGHRAWTFCGTAEYMPPEIIANTGHSFAADWWSFGILLYELTTGATPFADGSKETIYKKITAGTYYIPGYMSKELYSLVRHLLQSDPTRRYGNLRGRVDDIRFHSWWKDLDWKGIYAQTIKAPFKPEIPAAMFESRPLERRCLDFLPRANRELHADYFADF